MKNSRRNKIRNLAGDIFEAKIRTDAGHDAAITLPEDLPFRVAQIGFADPKTAADSFVDVALRLCGEKHFEDFLADIVLACLASPDPQAALVNLRRFLESVPSPAVFLGTIRRAPPLIEMLTTLFGSSQYMADIVIRNPGYFYWLMEQGTWDSADTVETSAGMLRRESAAFRKLEGKLNVVRRTQRKFLLKIGVRDLLGDATIEETTGSLSRLADAIAKVVLELVACDLGSAPGDIGGFTVIAMGKLGGGELNYSSDIDLIYVSEDSDDEKMEFYRKLALAYTAALSEVTGEGYLYRVDLRLRPDGEVGPLVNSETSMRIYYENRGRPWEFQAMLKARVLAGDAGLGNRLLDVISKLVFNPTLSYSPLEDIARMRAQITGNIPVRERAFNIKLMAGGIRDIEFAVQTLQLMHGQRDPELRTPNTIGALEQIRRKGYLKQWEVDNLSSAYRFFRLVEHRLQMMHQIKTHTVPESRAEIAVLARRVSKGPLGEYTIGAFLDELSKHLNNVRKIGESFFAGEEIHPYSVLMMLPEDDARADSIIRHHGIDDVRYAMRLLHAMAYGSFPRLYDRDTSAAFEKLLPYLLEDAAETANPLQTLVNFAQIAEASRSVAAFYRLLTESKLIRKRVAAVAGFSSYLTKRLCNQMEILDTVFVEPLNAFAAGEAELYDAQVAAQDDHAAVQRRDRQRSRLDRFRIGGFLLDVINRRLPLWLPLVVKDAVKKPVVGAFESSVADADKVAVFALGSFAVGEPRLFSDLDLIVVSDGADILEVTRQVQLINRWFTDGNLVKLDFRLRGEGASAPLVQDVSFYAQYFEKRMSLWEKIAFAKCEHWWGSRDVADKFLKLLRTAVVARPFTKDEITSLKKMRKSIEKLAPRTPPVWETKRSPGGRYDIEYLTAIGLARVAGETVFDFSMDNLERLHTLRRHGIIDAKELATLRGALGLYSTVEYLMELQELSLPRTREKSLELESYLDRVSEYLGDPFLGSAADALKRSKTSVRRCFDKFVDRMG